LAGALPQTPLAELTAPPEPLSACKGPTSKGEERRGGQGKGKKGLKGRKKEPPFQNVCVRTWFSMPFFVFELGGCAKQTGRQTDGQDP